MTRWKGQYLRAKPSSKWTIILRTVLNEFGIVYLEESGRRGSAFPSISSLPRPLRVGQRALSAVVHDVSLPAASHRHSKVCKASYTWHATAALDSVNKSSKSVSSTPGGTAGTQDGQPAAQAQSSMTALHNFKASSNTSKIFSAYPTPPSMVSYK